MENTKWCWILNDGSRNIPFRSVSWEPFNKMPSLEFWQILRSFEHGRAVVLRTKRFGCMGGCGHFLAQFRRTFSKRIVYIHSAVRKTKCVIWYHRTSSVAHAKQIFGVKLLKVHVTRVLDHYWVENPTAGEDRNTKTSRLPVPLRDGDYQVSIYYRQSSSMYLLWSKRNFNNSTGLTS